jgi:uncharacterized protein YbaP (TraB family)
MVNLFVAAALAAASPAEARPAEPAPDATAQAAATPAMFVVRDADTTIYLFGTFHALDGRSEWFGHGVRAAFDRSSELVLETLIPEAGAVTPPQPQPVPRFGNWSVAPSASFLATSRMAIKAGRARGMQVDNGADMVLRRAAEAAGKPIEALETIESQIDMFSQMPSAPGPAPSASAPAPPTATMNDLSDAMAEMQAAWKSGDQTVFVRMLGELRRSAPDTYRTLFAARNARWADWVGARMESPGTIFVAVGAGHLAGSDSLLVRLAELGIASARVD